MEAQTISCVVEPLVKEEENLEMLAQSNIFQYSDHVTPTTMAKEQHKDPALGLFHQYVLAGNKLRPANVAKVKSKAA